jgi:hypothetical protein
VSCTAPLLPDSSFVGKGGRLGQCSGMSPDGVDIIREVW